MLEGEPKAPIAPGFNAMKRVIQRFGADLVSQQQRWFWVLRTNTVKVSGFPETTFLFSVRSKITESKKKKKQNQHDGDTENNVDQKMNLHI